MLPVESLSMFNFIKIVMGFLSLFSFINFAVRFFLKKFSKKEKSPNIVESTAEVDKDGIVEIPFTTIKVSHKETNITVKYRR